MATPLGADEVEAFGQSEALTKRIAHILEQYPDGPSIMSELIQNADDAGASRVCVVYNRCTYGTESLLSPEMAKWQGPALYCYNDAEFTDADFLSLARIGQASKLQRASTTGRFGLGFNSVYHFTDLPSIVSANSIVMFDPHATHLPGISAANPGLRIRFANANIVKQYPDQFAPFKNMFGCDLTQRYNGTLFRFPLRTNELAEVSEIKRRGYSEQEIVDLFKSFQGSIADTMLFLRNVREVEVYLQSEIDQPPVLLYGAEVPAEDRGDSWRKIDRFMKGDEPRDASSSTAGLSAKKAFYERLRSTPTEELPSVTQVLHIQRRHRNGLREIFRSFDRDSEVSTNELLNSASGLEETVEEYLVCNQIGGGKARDMACAAENEFLKLIPWVGIASRIDGMAMEGRAFCFLPLPVRVGLPVHINGYFELSSNRRDIWHGDDMAGDGKLRSEWNTSVLVDAVAPAYLTFLLKAKSICEEDPSKYISFFPSKLPASPWSSIVVELFRIMKDQPVFFSSRPQQLVDGESIRSSVAPNSCVLVDDTINEWEKLEGALNIASLSTVHLPSSIRDLLIQLDAVYSGMTPDLFRQLTRKGTILPALEKDVLNRVILFCLSDCHGSSNSRDLRCLDQLQLIPLMDGQFGRFCFHEKTRSSSGPSKTQQAYYFGDAIEEKLLEAFPHRVIRGEFKQLFDQLPSVYENSNIHKVDLTTILETFLPHVLGRCWNKGDGDVYTLVDPSSEPKQSQDAYSSDEWIRLLWAYVETKLLTEDQLPTLFTKWPLIPIMSEGSTAWVCLAANVSLVLPHTETASVSKKVLSQLQHVLTSVGVHVVDTSYVSGEKCMQWLLNYNYAQKLTSNGLLAALSRYQYRHDRQSFDEIFASVSAPEREVLSDFFAKNGFDAVSSDLQPILFELPIFPVYPRRVSYASAQDSEVYHVSLRRGGYLPDANADTRVLNDSFFRLEKDTTRRFLRECGVEEWTYTKILLDHVFPQLSVIEAQNADLVDSIVVTALETLPFHQRNDSRFRGFVTTSAVIPSRKRVLRPVNQLHDPSVGEVSELVGENSLPAEAFSTPQIVEILRSLGLRTGLSCHAVLESARFIETIYREEGEESTSRACAKAHSLLKVVNKHFDTMTDDVAGEKSQDAHEINGIIAELKEVCWLPVRLDPIDPAMPWKRSSNTLSCARNMRPQKDAWLCSFTTDILDGELASEELTMAFGWSEQVDPLVIAQQLVAIGSCWEEQYRVRKMEGTLLSSPKSSQSRRFPLAELHLMYEELENYRLSHEEDWETSAIHHRLANSKWIWTGKTFVYPSQIAIEADDTLEPLLYCCPSQHIIPQSLLASFGLKDTFTTADYLQATTKISRDQQLSDQQIAACVKIYEVIGKDLPSLEAALESFTSEDIVLLDDANRLVPAVHLTFDDMKWNESREVRRGVAFISDKVPQKVAALLGAASLHSKLAQSSVTSKRIVCPPVNALQRVIPPQSEWCHALLWETILAAERFGGNQVEFFMDFRHHASQRVIQPSLQPLQDEAICIHIHNVVLSENDINNLFHGEASRAGLLSGFAVSDCMEILSGDGFYILDPTGCYLSSSVGGIASSKKGKSIGRRYDVLSQAFVRYPDQLLPFTALPSCPGNVSRGTQSTLIRFPWRKVASDISDFVLDGKKVGKLVGYIKAQLFQTLIFTETVYRISIWSVGKESEFASHCHGEAALTSHERTLRKRNITQQNQEWKKKFSLRSFFKSPVTPENQIEFTVALELENRQHKDTWLLADNIGMGRSRDLACTAVHEMLHSTPYVSVACHLFRDGNPAPRLRGRVFKIVDTHQQVGLPVHINGCFKKSIRDKQLALAVSTSQGDKDSDFGRARGSEQQVAAGWNRILVEDGVADAYVKLLVLAKRSYESAFPRALYNLWPTLQKRGGTEIGAVIQTHAYRTLGTKELFLCTDGSFRSLNSGYQLDFSGMNIQVASFAQLSFPAFDISSRILADCSRLLPSRFLAVTPKAMRRYLRSTGSSEIHPDVCLSLLEYCLSDLPSPLPSEADSVWAEFHGLPLLPLEDGSIGVLRVNQRRTTYVIASFNQVELLRPLSHLFVSVAAHQWLYKYFAEPRFISVFGLTTFSIKTLSDNIERVLPSSWKHQTIVDWDPASPRQVDQLWLYRFWQEVSFERRSLGYFTSWPLIPVNGSRLVSCGKSEMAVCVWSKSANEDIAAQVADMFQASITQHEKKMTDLEVERKHLMELSAVKFNHEDEVDEDCSSDEERSEHAEIDELTEDTPSADNDTSLVMNVEDVSLEVPTRDASHNEEHGDNFSTSFTGETLDTRGLLSPDSDSFSSEINGEDEGTYDTNQIVLSDGFSAQAVDDETREFCTRETLHGLLCELNVTTVELAYLAGQERDIVPRSPDLALTVLDGIFASVWNELRWKDLNEEKAVLLAEFFSHNGGAYDGYNRAQLEKLKQLPIYINVRDVPCSIHGSQDFFLIPPDLNLTDIPVPSSAQHRFLKSNPHLNGFYKELGVEEMSDSKLLMFAIPMYSELVESQRDQILELLLQKWSSLRGNADLIAMLRTAPLFREQDDEGNSQSVTYHPAGTYCDPRNSVLATIYEGVHGQFPAKRFQTPQWLDLMGEIGLRTEVTVDIFVECAQRIDGLCSGKHSLSSQDEHLVTTLHQFFVQHFDKFDRSRSFFERVSVLAFVPAIVYEATQDIDSSTTVPTDSSNHPAAHFTSRTVVRKYSDCATPDDQALVYSTMPILSNAALPPRVLWSRLGIRSPPPEDQVLAHLLAITNGDRELSSRSLDWQFFLPMVEVFQTIFKFLQEHWDGLGRQKQQMLRNAAVIPVGSTLVKGSRLFFHLGENLAPLMFEVPRAFGAYDTLFRHMGSKEAPEVRDYLRLLRDLNEECRGEALNLNELVAASRAIELLAGALAESNHRLALEDKKQIFLPSGTGVMRPMLVMAFNDSAALCASIDLAELHMIHPRISTRCCQILGVPGISSVVTEELTASNDLIEVPPSDSIAHFNNVLGSLPFADGLRKVITAQQQKAMSYDAFGYRPDFADLNQRIVNLTTFEVKCVAELHTRFIARLGFPARSMDVTKADHQGSLSFLDQERKRLYIAQRTLETRSGMRAAQLVAKCINQLLGGVLQDGSVLESLLTCDELEIPEVLQLLDIYEDPVLIVEKLRGQLGEPLSDADYSNVELAPLRSCLPGELVAVEGENGTLCYGKILREQPSSVAGVSHYEVKVSNTTTRWLMATQLYFFKSARVGTSGAESRRDNAGRPQPDTTPVASQESLAAMPASVVAIPSNATAETNTVGSTPAVSSANVLSAVNDLLSRLNVSLDTSVEDLLAENLRLQRRLELAEEGRRAAAAQIDSVLREKKEAQDSLVCAVCLENKVNRVLIPCGHIYCSTCVERLPRPSCPICRQRIQSSSAFHVPS